MKLEPSAEAWVCIDREFKEEKHKPFNLEMLDSEPN